MIENIIYGTVIALETILFVITIIYITKSKNRLYNDLQKKYNELEEKYKKELFNRLINEGKLPKKDNKDTK